jgi:hypothetical protein
MGEIKYKIADSSRAFINKDKDSVQTKNLQTYILKKGFGEVWLNIHSQ